jgi:hypothetical protein
MIAIAGRKGVCTVAVEGLEGIVGRASSLFISDCRGDRRDACATVILQHDAVERVQAFGRFCIPDLQQLRTVNWSRV